MQTDSSNRSAPPPSGSPSPPSGQSPTPPLSFEDAVSVCLRRYADFSGRARRSEFWWFWLFNTLASVMALLLDNLAFEAPAFGSSSSEFYTPGVFGFLVSLVLFLPFTAASVRRLHDTDRSGWWVAAFISGKVAFLLSVNAMAALPALILLAGMIVFFVWLATHGTIGANRFGADPCAAPPSSSGAL